MGPRSEDLDVEVKRDWRKKQKRKLQGVHGRRTVVSWAWYISGPGEERKGFNGSTVRGPWCRRIVRHQPFPVGLASMGPRSEDRGVADLDRWRCRPCAQGGFNGSTVRGP